MDYILDTNIVSNLRKRKPHPALLSWLRDIPASRIFMSTPTVAELQCGVGQIADRVKAAEVQSWLDGLLSRGYPSIVPFDSKAAVILGRMWTTPSLTNFVKNDPRARKHKSGADLAVAACAIAHQMAIATDDYQDFLQINAKFELPGLFSPFDRAWAGEASGPA